MPEATQIEFSEFTVCMTHYCWTDDGLKSPVMGKTGKFRSSDLQLDIQATVF